MPSLLPFLSLASFAIASASADTLIWSKVDTTKPSSASPLVWSKVETAMPTSTSPLVWSKVETSKSSSSSSVPSTSPLVWSKVVTSTRPTTTTTSTPIWTRVITTRAPSTTTLVPSSPSPTPCGPLDPSATTLPSCLGSQTFDWFNLTGYTNYKPTYESFLLDKAGENSTHFLSGVPCRNLPPLDKTQPVMLISVSTALAKLHGGFDAVCGKELDLFDPNLSVKHLPGLRARTMIVHSCSESICPGVSIGVGPIYNFPNIINLLHDTRTGAFHLATPFEGGKEYKASWVA